MGLGLAGRDASLVAAATFGLTIFLYFVIPKGFFPIQDTGVIQGVSEAAQSVSFPEMSRQQQLLTKIILQDPVVDNLSSFIGGDGTNTALNSGRILINLKPLSPEPSMRATSSDACSRNWRRCRELLCSCSRFRISRSRTG